MTIIIDQTTKAALDAQAARQASIATDPGRLDLLARLKKATPAEIDAYIEANVTNLAQARNFLKALTKVLAVAIHG